LEDVLGRVRPLVTQEGWQGYRPFVVDRKVMESEKIASFHLRPNDGLELPPFFPGQYLTLKLQVESQAKPVTRTYSISSSPNRRDGYRITVKRLDPPPDVREALPGIGSSHLHDNVDTGNELSIKAPRGKFFLDPRTDSPIVLLSAGVGLTPLVSMLAAVANEGSARRVWFVHGARNGREHALRDEVLQLSEGHENIQLHFAYSRPTPEDIAGRDFDSQGRITIDLLKQILPPAAYDFYLCGPTPFMQELYRDLEAWGVPPARIHYEFFGPAADLTEGRKTREPESGDGVWAVSFTQSEMNIRWDSEFGNILELAEANGLRPDFSCRAGICHTCSVPLIRGEVEYACEPIELPDPGHVLICCAKPRTDVVIDV
jgi:ferredoxin-NADP reductase